MAIVIDSGDAGHDAPDDAYASVGDLARYLGVEEAPAGAARMLARASDHLGPVLALARYATVGGVATDTAIRSAIARATCAQVEQWLEVGEDHAIAGFPVDTAMSRGKVSESKRPAVYAPRALAILAGAGLRVSL